MCCKLIHNYKLVQQLATTVICTVSSSYTEGPYFKIIKKKLLKNYSKNLPLEVEVETTRRSVSFKPFRGKF